MQYTPVCCQNDLKLGDAFNSIVVSGWSDPVSIEKMLPRRAYASLGSLYSIEIGIGFLLRNLIANPQINILIGLRLTKQDRNSNSVAALSSFFETAYYLKSDDDSRSDKKIYDLTCERLSLPKAVCIDDNIPQEYLDKVAKRVVFYLFDDLATAKKCISKMIDANLIYSASFNSKSCLKQTKFLDFGITFPYSESKAKRFQGSAHGLVLRHSHLYRCWLNLVKTVFTQGIDSFSRNGSSTRDINNLMVVLSAQQTLSYLDTEVADYSLLPVNKDYLEDYALSLTDTSDDNSDRSTEDSSNYVHYSYGDRLYRHFGSDRVITALEQITKNPFSTTVIDLWDGNSDPGSQQPPCLISITLGIDLSSPTQKLDMTAVFRSHDIYSAWYANAYGLLKLQQKMVSNLPDCQELGKLTIVSQSAHIYSHAFSPSQKIADLVDRQNREHQKQDFNDPCGNFIISLESGVIQIRRENRGVEVKTYRGKNPKLIFQDLVNDAPALDPHHCFYLGTELEKAAIALKAKLKYTQDRFLPNQTDRLLRANA